MKKLKNRTLALAAGVVFFAASAGAQVIYTNDFTTADNPMSINFAQYEGQDPWTLDTGAGVLNVSAAIGGSTSSHLEPPSGAASVQLPGWSGADFTISSVFTLNNPGGLVSGSRANVVGIGFFGNTPDFTDALYRAEIAVSEEGQNFGRVTLTRAGGGSFATAGAHAEIAEHISQGVTLELRVSGTFSNGSLFIDVGVYDEFGGLLGARGTAEDANPLAGEHFGFRVRAPGGGTNTDPNFDVDFQNFQVVPEPSTVAVILGGLALATALIVRRRRGG